MLYEVITDEIPADALQTQPLKIDWTFWCDRCDGMASMRTCPRITSYNVCYTKLLRRSMPWFRWQGNDLILRLRITARAGRDGFVGVVNDCLKVRIAAAPVQGRANAHLIDFLARQFDILV